MMTDWPNWASRALTASRARNEALFGREVGEALEAFIPAILVLGVHLSANEIVWNYLVADVGLSLRLLKAEFSELRFCRVSIVSDRRFHHRLEFIGGNV